MAIVEPETETMCGYKGDVDLDVLIPPSLPSLKFLRSAPALAHKKLMKALSHLFVFRYNAHWDKNNHKRLCNRHHYHSLH